MYDLELQRLYGYLFQRRGAKFAVVYSLDGYDELSLTGPARVVADTGVQEYRPSDFGVAALSPDNLKAPSTVEGRATTTQMEVVVANAALAMRYAEGKRSLAEYQDVAREGIRSGKALKALQGSRGV